ncbi:hypothetical protein K4F52_006488 [Lecanicillium sp. MT-2017a]|nr:hypothetical protein K4F52_006488 [Lecanicillium sp. MT-2017a]
MRSFTFLAVCVAAVTAADKPGSVENPVESQLSSSCPLTQCYMEPTAKNQGGAAAVACSIGYQAPEGDLPQGCSQRCKPCRAEVCTAVCIFEAFCESGPCPEAMAKMMSGSEGSGGACNA